MTIRKEVKELKHLGPLPSEVGVDLHLLDQYEALYRAITPPVTNEEAAVLVHLFGNDGAFGLAQANVTLIESAPGWPLEHCLRSAPKNQWTTELRQRVARGGKCV